MATRKCVKCDAWLIERELDEALSKSEIEELVRVLPEGETFIPIEIQGEYGSAMGFITYHAADVIDFFYDGDSPFYQFVQAILDNKDLEREDKTYTFTGVKSPAVPFNIYLTR